MTQEDVLLERADLLYRAQKWSAAVAAYAKCITPRSNITDRQRQCVRSSRSYSQNNPKLNPQSPLR